MVFARCLAVESDLFFASPSARTSHSARVDATYKPNSKTTRTSRSTEADASSSSSSSIMPTILGWGRKSSTSSAADPRSSTNNQELSSSHASSCKMHTHHHSHARPSHRSKKKEPTRSNPHGGVTFRRGDKSFLEFHQNYAITRHLGEGSYSTVKQVTHRKRGGVFACKIVDKNALSPVDRIALSQEVHVLASVRHDHVMRLYEVIEDDAKCYLILEIAEHGDLFDKIVKQGKFPQCEAQKVTAALCEALFYCHSNAIIHRDVKPENVLLSGDPHAIKLCDFGFAKQLRDVTEKSVDSCGTPGYAAPEILDGKPYGLEVDVFSLGVVTYIMICGYPPFPMKLSQLRNHRFNVRFPSKDWSHIDTSVKDMITKMLHVKPDLRPKMGELRKHPWIQQGKQLLDEACAVAEERKHAEAFQRKQLIADTIRKKLTSTTGFEVVKHGRQGQPHRTKLRLSTDGRVLSWQPKLLKRGLLKYHQNAKSLTSFFGFGGSIKAGNNQTPSVAHPQISRLSSLEATRSSSEGGGGRFSEPIRGNDAVERSQAASRATEGPPTTQRGSQQLSKTDSVSSTTSTTSTGSTSWIDRKNWWRSFRRSDKTKESGPPDGRSASGGATFAAFSLAPTDQRPAASRSFSASSSGSAASDANEMHGVSRIGFGFAASHSSEPTSPTGYRSPSESPRRSGMITPPLSPSACATTERMLDSSVNLRDIRSVTLGEDSPFFQSSKGCCCCKETCGARSNDTTVVTATATMSIADSALESDDDDKRATGDSSELLDVATTMTVATRYRELHLEFPSEEIRDAFAFLLEQATLPLEDVAHRQPSFIVRSASTACEKTQSFAEPEEWDKDADGSSNNNNEEHRE